MIRISSASILLYVSLYLLLALGASGQSSTRYTVNYRLDRPDRINVVIAPGRISPGPVTLVIPRAIPSGYSVQFNDRFIENVGYVTEKGERREAVRAEGPRWTAGTSESTVAKIEYEVNLSRLEREILDAANTSKVREGYVGLLGYTVFGYIDGSEEVPVRLEVNAPRDWPVFSTLAPKSPADKGMFSADVPDFFHLADSQIAIGPRLEVHRTKASVPSFLIIYSEVPTDVSKHANAFAGAFESVLAYFGEAPFPHYTAYIEILKPVSENHRYGFSMEHLNSSNYFLGVDRAYGPDSDDGQFLRERFNLAHHIIHSWIPKRVYGTGYRPFTWELPPLIDTIWFNEGFARFAAIEALADRATPEQRDRIRESQFASLRSGLAAIPEFIREMPLVDLSRIGSTMYADDFRTGRTLYYKGALMALELDELIREKTGGRKRLRDSLRAMVKWGIESNRPFRLEELPGLIAKPVGVNEDEVRSIIDRWKK